MATRPIASKSRRAILAGSITSLVMASVGMAADVFIPPNLTINSDAGSPLFTEGLIEGFLNGADNETDPNPNNSSPELGLRMATLGTGGGGDFWADNRTWVYTGEIFTGPNGVISVAANNDDNDWFRINGNVVLNDNGWDTTTAAVVTGLTPNTWVSFEYRVGNGGGGAGPSGQNINGASNWTNTRGAVISHDNEANSLDANAYTFGLAGVGSYEPAGGGPTLFRYQSGFGFSDDIKVTGSGTITIDGTNANVAEPSLAFQTTGATLTVNDGTGSHKTLSFSNGTTLGNANGQSNTINGTSDVRLGPLLDGGFTGLTLTHTGPGRLILDGTGAGNNAAGATIAAGVGGNVFVQGAGSNPLNTLGSLAISGAGGTITFAGAGAATYNTAIAVNESGTIAHTGATGDIIGGTNGITIAATKTLTINNTSGLVTVAGAVSGGGALLKSGTGDVNITGNVSVPTVTNSAGVLRLNSPGTTNVAVLGSTGGILRVNNTSTITDTAITGGRVEINGQTTLINNPTISGSGVLALRNGAGTNAVPTQFSVSAGTLEIVPGALGAATVQANLNGGTLTLDAPHGLLGRYYNGDDGGARNAFGGPAFPANTYSTYTTYFATRDGGGGGGAAAVTALTGAGEVTQLKFDTSEAQFSAYGFNALNNMVSRQFGKILITQPGTYTFGTTSDDGSMLYINGTPVANNNEYQGATRRTGTFLFATPGLYDIDIGFYEGGGGNSLTVDWAGPATGGATQFIPNTVLFENATPATFANPINVVSNSTINVDYHTAVADSLTVQPGATLSKTGNNLVAAPILPSAGAYGFNVTGDFTVTNLQDAGADVDITKSGSGVLILDNTTTPQLQNAGSSITINQGAVGLVLESGGLNPLGNATVNYNGGGVVLTSKGGDQTFALPTFTGGGLVEARRVGSGVAGPININLTGNLNIPAGQTVTLGTADSYVMNVGGTGVGTGTLAINGGQVNVTSAGGINGFKLLMNPPVAANLDVDTANLALQSMASTGAGTSSVTVGVGGATTVTLNGSDSARFTGSLIESAGSTVSLLYSGTGRQTFGGDNTFTGGVTINSGTLEFVGAAALDANAITLNGGTLQLGEHGLKLRIYDADPGATGAYNGALNTLTGALNYYSTLPGLATTTLTSANGNTLISYNPGAGAEAPFAIHGNTDADTVQAIFTGKFRADVAGDYVFDPRSDDGTMVYVNGVTVSNNNFPQGIGHVPRPGTINLTAGLHDIVIAYNEGGGGAGMYVNVTTPGGTATVLSNSLLQTDYTGSNVVNLAASATVDPQGTTTTLGTLNHTVGTTLTTGSGTVAFATTNAAAGVHGFTTQAGSTMIPGQIVDGGNAVTINKNGPGTLLLNATTPQLTNAGSSIVVSDGQLALVGTGAATPTGNATVNLANNTTLALGSTAGAASFNPNVALGGSVNITAGNVGGGSVNGPVTTTLNTNLSVGAGNTITVSSSNNYTLALGGTVSGAGSLTQSGGTVQTTGTVNIGGPVNVNAGTFTASNVLTTPAVNVNAGATLRTSGAVTSTVNVGAGATYQVSGGTLSGAVQLNGGLLQATSGVTNFGSSTITSSGYAANNTAGALKGSLHVAFTNPSGGYGTDLGIFTTLNRTPQFTANLDATNFPQQFQFNATNFAGNGDLAFGSRFNADGAFATFFGTTAANTDSFTATFTGKFTANSTGAYTFGKSINDDSASIWVDLNQNGLFETNGSAGNERIVNQAGCCGDSDDPNATNNGVVNLVNGQSYNMVFIVEDTGGGSSYAAKWAQGAVPGNGGLANFVNPGAQSSFWSFDAPTGGGNIRLDAASELRAGAIVNTNTVAFAGPATLRLSGAASNVDNLTNIAGTGTSTVDLGATSTLTAGNLSVAPGTTLIKAGAGTLMANAQSLGNTSTLQIDGGTVNLLGAATASSGAANGGGVIVGSGATLNIGGSISGAVQVNGGGTLKGIGSVGATTIFFGTLAPGNSVGTITTGDLLSFGTLQEEIASGLSYDTTIVNGTVDITDTTLSLSLLSPSQLAIGDKLFILQNDGLDAIVGTFSGLADNSTVTVGEIQFQITYDADFGTLGLDGGNDVALTVLVPEPSSLVALFGGIGVLACVRRFRRRS